MSRTDSTESCIVPTKTPNENSFVNVHHLKERQVSDEAVVEVDFGCEPRVVVERRQNNAVVLRTDDVEAHCLAKLVDAAAESAAEQVDAHDAEDEPEDETDEQHVEDGWDRLDQRVHYDLHARKSRRRRQRFFVAQLHSSQKRVKEAADDRY